MANAESSAVLRHVRALFGAGAAGGASDRQLLERYRRGGPDAEAAFAVLVARHGPMVLGVCRRSLRDPEAVADAFQATFLVLVRKSGSVQVEDTLGRWLYGVSRRVVARSRAQSARLAAREVPGPGPEPTGPGDDPFRRELIAILDEEVARLPEPFRAAVVLCDLDGMTHEDAARQLSCPVGTIESRLSRGRKRLRERLAGRGLSPGAVLPAGLLRPEVPGSLSAATIASAARAASASAAVSTLIEGVLADMTWTKMKSLAAWLGSIAVVGGLGMIAARYLKIGESPPTPQVAPAAVVNRPNEPAPFQLRPPAKVRPGDTLRIEVLQALPGRPIGGTHLVRPDGTISLGFYGDLKVAGLDRTEIKVKLIEHLRKYIRDEALGLERPEDEGDKKGNREEPDPFGPGGDPPFGPGGAPPPAKFIKIAPADSNVVYVDESEIYAREAIRDRPGGDSGARVEELELKLDRLIREVENLKRKAR